MKCLRLLLERGAKIIPDNDGVSPLELCAKVIEISTHVASGFHPGFLSRGGKHSDRQIVGGQEL